MSLCVSLLALQRTCLSDRTTNGSALTSPVTAVRAVDIRSDGASCHTAHDSKALAAQLGITLIWLPPRCPQLNPLDRLWKCAKQKVCANRQYRSMDEQEDRFTDYLQSLSPQEALRKAGLLSKNFWLFRMNGRTPQRGTSS